MLIKFFLWFWNISHVYIYIFKFMYIMHIINNNNMHNINKYK